MLGAQLAHAYEPGVQLRLCQAMVRAASRAGPLRQRVEPSPGMGLLRQRWILASDKLAKLSSLRLHSDPSPLQARICAAEPPAGTAAVHLNAIETCTTCALQSHRDDPHVLEAALSALAWLIRAGGSDAAVRASYLSLPEAVFDVTHKKFAQDPVIAVRFAVPITA